MTQSPLVYQLVYGSIGVRPMSTAELGELLRHARAKNERLQVTGVLLYQDGAFLQALEGQEAVVTSVFHTIARDPRHAHVNVVWSGKVAARSFGDWSMAFASAADPRLEALDGYRDFFGRRWLAATRVEGSRVTELVYEFRNLPWRDAMNAVRAP